MLNRPQEDVMPVISLNEMLGNAFRYRYGVGAFNIVNDLTMDAVLAAAEETRSPVIIQVSVKTVKQMGAQLIRIMFEEMADRVSIPATLHLDHCPDRKVIEDCVAARWNSVLFDASGLSYEENLAQTSEVVAMAHRHDVAVEGELEAIKGVEDGVGSEYGGAVVSLDRAVRFMRETGIDCFAPAIGTAHGLYKGEPKINFERVSEIVAAEPLPLVLHGGTGLSDPVFQGLIARGAVKVNISTQLKITFADSFRTYLAERPTEYDPLKLLTSVKKNVQAMAANYMRVFGSAGRA
jgi:fructose-bisphosphate aldolase class II